jgi:hypothetical protein
MQIRFRSLVPTKFLTLALSLVSLVTFADKAKYVASFADFNERANSARPVSVVFFGGALTWGEGASEPERTSFRALTENFLKSEYPKAKFSFYDAAIGGAGSKLGMFRVQSDVLARNPDLVFVDFALEDHIDGTDQQTLTSYERILRDIIAEGVPVVEILLGSRTNFAADWKFMGPERLRGYKEFGLLYHTAIANTFPVLQNYFKNGIHTRDEIWPHDDVNVNDLGHQLVFQAVRAAFKDAVNKKRRCNFPQYAVFADDYAKRTQFFLANSTLPDGWHVADSLRSSFEPVKIANDWMKRVAVSGVADRESVQPIQLDFNGTFVGILGEADEHGLPFKVRIDGAPVMYRPKEQNWPTSTAKLGGGDRFFWHEISDTLVPGRHLLEIEPVVSADDRKGELRIESICIAGPENTNAVDMVSLKSIGY